MRHEKIIRIWNGCTVIAVLAVKPDGGTTQFTAGGAANSTTVDIEIDPWAGLIVDHMANISPVLFREEK